MQFNSYDFIFFFLPLTVLFYFAANRIRPVLGKLVLIIAGIVFYALGRPEMLVCLGISMAVTYGSVLLIRKSGISSRLLRALPVAVNVGLLLYFKYLNFAITNFNTFSGKELPLQEIILPLGISFYTFQQIAYIAAAEQGRLPDISLIDYLVYVLYFPKLVMGPLADPVDFISQLNQKQRKKPDPAGIAAGIKIFSLGLIKKALLADTFARAVSWAYSELEAATAMDCVLLMLFYTFELYFDFSGYSDMAVGVSSMLNIDLPMNFDSPYKAVSVRDFWKRWHMTLTGFLTRYVYIPLGGSRKGLARTCLNTLIVFLISGLWHGANWTFILWGLIHGLLSCLDRLLEKAEEKVFRPVRWLCTFAAVNVTWLLFSAESVGQWITVLRKILSIRSAEISDGLIAAFDLPETGFLFNLPGLASLSSGVRGLSMMLFVLAACVICFIPENNYRKKQDLDLGSLLLAALAFVWGVLCLGTESQFLYFGF